MSKRIPIMCFVFAFLLSTVFSASLGFAETWVDRSGNFRIEAKFKGVEGKDVLLEKPDGTVVRVPISKLDPESVALAKRLYEASKKKDTPNTLGDNPTLEQTLERVEQLSKSTDPAIAWDLLPNSHRQDVNELVQLGARSIDTQTWNAATELIQKCHRLFAEKEEFLINSNLLHAKDSPVQSQDLMRTTVAVLELMLADLLASNLVNHETMKKFDGDHFFETQYPNLKDRALAIVKVGKQLSPDGWAQFGVDSSFEIVSRSGDSAEVKMTLATGEELQTYRRIDNRWVPDRIVQSWDGDIAKAKQLIRSLETVEGKQNLAKVQNALAISSSMLEPMLKSKSQAEFDQAASGFSVFVSMFTQRNR